MRKIVIAHLLIIYMLSEAVAAESIWKPWSNQENGKWYLLKDSIEFDDYISSAWFMFDFNSPQNVDGKELKSIRVKYRFNCKEFTRNMLSFKVYSKEMGTGQIVESFDNVEDNEFVTFSPDEWENNGFQIFCKKQWEIWK